MNAPKLIAILASILVLEACDKGKGEAEKILKLETEVSSLSGRIQQVESDVFGLQIRTDLYEWAEFDPAASRGYGRVDSVGGLFLVSLENVQPYLDGVRVTLEIGNVQSASYSGFTIESRYGKRFPKYNKDIPVEERTKQQSAYSQAKREKTVIFTETLRPRHQTRRVW